MPKPATKKKCANPNCSNPKCPFPHYVSPAETANETKTTNAPTLEPDSQAKNEATYLPYPTGDREFLKLRMKKKTIDSPTTPVPTSTLDIVCLHCGHQFGLTLAGQEFYARKSFQLPKRCRDCRVVRDYDRFNIPYEPKPSKKSKEGI
jgi:hypothetical protein